MIKKPLTYVSLFSSAGVGCYGFKLNNFECIITNELLEKRLNIQRFNNKCKFETGYLLGDISKSEVKNRLLEELKFWDKKFKIKELDVLIATPPCQGMSVANHKKNNEKKRNSLVVESIDLTRKIKPKFFIFENVRAFLNTICTDSDNIDKKIKDVIEIKLGGDYNILSRVINFKNYGANSSRTRTLVIGVRKDIYDLTPYDFFPKEKKPLVLRDLIGNLPSLKTMGEITNNDIYHSYRSFDKRMLPWIENTVEGQSAFENIEEKRIPHKIINDKIVLNKQKNGDKYARWYWDREGPCIHTRNDILSSQNTIHPKDNRVFSIRELMRMMTIPENFKWSSQSFSSLNKMVIGKKKDFLKKEELNIRHCIGEAVPTEIFKQIAYNIKIKLENTQKKISYYKDIIKKNNIIDFVSYKDFLENNIDKYTFQELFTISELVNTKKQTNSAFYTRQDICYSAIKGLPDFKSNKVLKILEPSVGVGNFIPLIFQKYKEINRVELDVIDIDKNSLYILRKILTKITIPNNFKIRFIETDFLLWLNEYKYDLVIGNPPYNKIVGNKDLLLRYKKGLYNQKTNNIFSFFIEKSLNIAKVVSLIVPKSLINSPEFNMTRKLLESRNLIKIIDYGESAFRGVKIETINILINNISKVKTIKIESYIKKSIKIYNKNYIFDENFPYWLIYRNKEFDNIVDKLELDVFTAFRDRQILKSHTKSKGKIRVLRSKNIINNGILNISGYDRYVDDCMCFVISKYINCDKIVLVPNLTYFPRATFLPKNSITDGSIALLKLKDGSKKITTKDLNFYATEQFTKFYRIARNFGTRSLNIDNNSVFYFGLLKQIIDED